MSLCLQSAQEYRKRDDHWAPQHHFWPWIEIVEQRLAAGHEPDSSAAMALQTFIELFKELRLILVEDAPLLMKETLSTIPSVSSVTHPVKATLGFQSKVWDLDFFAHPSSPFPLYAEQHCKEVELDILEHARKCVPEGLQIMEAIKAWGCQTLAILMIILRNTSGMSMQAPIQQLLPNLVNPSPSASLLEAATTDPSTSGLPMASEIQAILAAAAGTRAGGSHASTSGCIAGASAVGNEAPVEEPPGILSAQAATARDQAPEATGGTAPARHGRTKQTKDQLKQGKLDREQACHKTLKDSRTRHSLPLMKNNLQSVAEVWAEWEQGLSPSFLSLQTLNDRFGESWRCTDATKKKYSNRAIIHRAVERVLADMQKGVQTFQICLAFHWCIFELNATCSWIFFAAHFNESGGVDTFSGLKAENAVAQLDKFRAEHKNMCLTDFQGILKAVREKEKQSQASPTAQQPLLELLCQHMRGV